MNPPFLDVSMKKRLITGFLMLAGVVAIAWIDHFSLTWAVLGLLYMIAFHEAMKLFLIEESSLYVYALVVWLVAYVYPHPDDLIYLILLFSLGMMAYKKELNYRLLIPFFYPCISMLFLLALYHDFGMQAFLWLIVVVGLTDTGAYFVGKSIGKTPFSPTSPNKTLEGVLGGVAIGSIAGTFIGTFFVPILLAFGVSLVCAVACVFGDLFESLLKREAGVKDSGTLFPGHGGVLDRMDGYLFAVIVMTILLRGFA